MSSPGGRQVGNRAPGCRNLCSASAVLASLRLAIRCAFQSVFLAVASTLFAQAMAPQSRFEDGLDGSLTSWRIERGEPVATLLAHTHTSEQFRAGGGAELVRFSTTDVETVRLVHDLPAARTFDEFNASIWVKSNRQSVMFAARVRFPHATDPRTDEPLTVEVLGDHYTTPQQWKQLTCLTTEAAIRRALIRLRSQQRQFPAGSQLDTREAYVDGVVVIVDLQPGATEVFLDELAAGPIITPAVTVSPPRENHDTPRVLIGDDHLRLNGAPFILRFTPSHGEPGSVLADCGFNATWIPNYTDAVALADLEQAGLYAIAELPVPPGIGDHTEEDRAQLEPLPFSSNPRILFWNVGTRLGPDDLHDLSAWSEMVRSADHEFARPLLAEVTGREREFHRRLDCLGASRHFLQTSTSPLAYLEFLRRERDLGFPDKPMFTHVQTEPDPGLFKRWPSGRTRPVIESEQIWLQAYAALAAGYKGIGFWKHTPLTQDELAGDERRLAIRLFNRHVELLEPWLASAKVIEVVPATFTDPASETRTGSGWGLQLLSRSARDAPEAPAGPVRVSVLESDAGFVLLPVWYEPDAQFQPGPMIADELYFKIGPKGEDVQQAWLVTTTDVSASPVELNRVEGGHQIRLSGFDQHAAIIITRKIEMIDELRQRIAALQESTARTWIDLAAVKLRRVQSVQAEFVDLGISVDHGDGLLDLARRRLREAETEFDARRFADAARKSQQSMAVLRIFQRAHWDRAVAPLASGVSSPYTIGFQTLPEHWRLTARLGSGVAGENLLKSGDFEDRDTMLACRWIPHHTADPSISAESQLRRRNAAQGDYALHLTARRRTPGPAAGSPEDATIRWISPPVSVYAGQIVFIGGQVRIDESPVEPGDGLLVYETLQGPISALRWREPAEDGDWQAFQMIREIQESGDLRVVIELHGLGDVSIDDIRVIAIDP